MVPLAIAGWAATWAGTSGQWGAIIAAGALGLVVGIAAAVMRSGWLAAAAAVLAVGLLIGGLQHHRLNTGIVAELATSEAFVIVDLKIQADAHSHPSAGIRPPYLGVRATTSEITGRGRSWAVAAPVLVTVSGEATSWWQDLRVGTSVRVQGRMQQPQPGADFAALLRFRGPAEVIAQPDLGSRSVERVREGLRQSVAQRRDEQRALVPALVLGDTSAMTTEITADFQTTGLTHLTAVSGANLTLMLAFVLLFARWCGVRGWWLRGVGLLGVLTFIALCRTEPSVLRAAAMGLVALAALGTGRGPKSIRHLSVAMLILLLIDPWLSRSIGFALSVLASAGIIGWASRWAEQLQRWLPRLVAESVAVPLAAHLATLPLVAAISGQISVVGIVTNALAGPFVGPATVLGFAAAGLSIASSQVAAVAGFGAAWSAQGILWVAHWGARFPGAAWNWPTEPVALIVAGAASLLAGLWMRPVLARPWLALSCALIMVFGFVRAPVAPGWPPKDWLLVACDVGQGDGLVVPVGNRQAIVIDVGPDPQPMDRCLDQLGITSVPMVILTHFHADHVDGLAAVFDGRRVGQISLSPLASPPGEVEEVRAMAAEFGATTRIPVVGEQWQLGGVSWQVLGPVPPGPTASEGPDGESSTENDLSLVIMMTIREVRLLLTGDVEPAGQQRIVQSGVDLRADVLKIPHHGSSRQDPAFFAATRARVAIASAGQDNDYGHPAPRTVQLAESLGMTVLRTDQMGSIAVVTTKDGLAAVTQR